MFEKIAEILRRRRLTYYALLLEETPLNAYNSRQVVPQLSYLWRRLRLKDLSGISSSTSALVQIAVYTKNILGLIDLLGTINSLIRDDDDNELERLMSSYKEKESVVLDFYLSDDNLHPIDILGSLIRLNGYIQDHHHLVNKFDNQYYQRLSTVIYHDIIILTSTLIGLERDPRGSSAR